MRLLYTLQRPMGGRTSDVNSSNSASIAPNRPGEYGNSTGISLFTPSRFGHIAPGESIDYITDATPKITALPLNSVVDSAGEVFVVLNNDRLVQFGLTDDTVDANHDTAHGGHSTIVHQDILTYKDSSDEYVLYSFNDATDADVGRRLKSTGAYDDDYLSTVPSQVNGSTLTKGVPHIMIIGPDGLIYITNGQYIAQFDQVNSIINYQRLNLGTGMIATSMTIDGNYLVISAYLGTTFITSYARSVARAFYWNTISPNFNKPVELNDNYVSAVYNRGGVIWAFTNGRGGMTRIQQLTGGNSARVVYENRTSAIGRPPRHGSIDDFSSLLHYVPVSGGDIKAVSDGGNFFDRSSISSTDLGMLNVLNDSMYIGITLATNPVTYKIGKLNRTTFETGGIFKGPLMLFPYKSTIEMIKIYFSKFGSSASVKVALFQGYDTLSIGGATDLLNKTIAYSSEGAIREYAVSKTIPNFSSGYFVANFDHASASANVAMIERVEFWGSTPDKR